MRQLATTLLFAVAGALPSFAVAEAANTQILQQRTRDGSILLTDRAVPGATTERSWQVRGEDPAAARQRAIDVKAEANLVSERIERRIAQQRLADQEEQRLRLARMDGERERAAQDDALTGGVLLFGPTRFRAGARLHPRDGGRAGRPHAGMRALPRITG